MTPARPRAATSEAMTAPVWRKLNALKALSVGQSQRLAALVDRIETAAPGAVLLTKDRVSSRHSFIVSGWACRQRLLPDGRRQIFSLLLPGDALAFSIDASPLAKADVVALTKVIVATADLHAAVAAPSAPLSSSASQSASSSAQAPQGFAEHMRRSAFLDEGLLLDHVLRLGRQTAFERTAHLLLEMHWRLALVGKTDAFRFSMPLTQEVLADFLGLSIVHVNRTLQQLRRERLIETSGAHIVLLDAAQLAVIADYQPPGLAPQS